MVDVPANISTTEAFEIELGENIGSYSGRIETVGDHDWLRITLEAGYTYRFFLSLQETGERSGNSSLTIRDAAGVQVAFADDGGAGQNSFLSFPPVATTGTFFVDIGESGNDARGAYSILFDRTFFGQTPTFLTGDSNTAFAGSNQEVGGGAGNDVISLLENGGFGALGEQGDDVLLGSDGEFNLLAGGLGNDLADGQGGDDVIFGDAGDDSLFGGNGTNQLFGGDGFDNLFGGADTDYLKGGADDDVLRGEAGNDTLEGGTGDDILFGLEDADILVGGAGRDIMTGGSGLDTFDFNAKTESVKGTNRDVIRDFSGIKIPSGDLDQIDLSDIDAKKGHGNQAFHFIGKQGFHHKAGELQVKYNAVTDVAIVQGDIDGNGKADFQIEVHSAAALARADFIL
jgi:Ca2+-binding RTX toxin-like protein